MGLHMVCRCAFKWYANCVANCVVFVYDTTVLDGLDCDSLLLWIRGTACRRQCAGEARRARCSWVADMCHASSSISAPSLSLSQSQKPWCQYEQLMYVGTLAPRVVDPAPLVLNLFAVDPSDSGGDPVSEFADLPVVENVLCTLVVD